MGLPKYSRRGGSWAIEEIEDFVYEEELVEMTENSCQYGEKQFWTHLLHLYSSFEINIDIKQTIDSRFQVCSDFCAIEISGNDSENYVSRGKG